MSIGIHPPITLETALGDPAELDRQAIMERVRPLDETLWRHASSVADLVTAVLDGHPDGGMDRRSIIDAAWLHDIGKLTIAPSILDKSGPLDSQEWAEIRTHPMRGATYLERNPRLTAVAALVRSHHEWHNGAGYPAHKSGDEIAIGARLIGIADAYDAMTSWRPYRSALTYIEAIAELQRCAGTQFDPELVDRFISTATTVRKDSTH